MDHLAIVFQIHARTGKLLVDVQKETFRWLKKGIFPRLTGHLIHKRFHPSWRCLT